MWTNFLDVVLRWIHAKLLLYLIASGTLRSNFLVDHLLDWKCFLVQNRISEQQFPNNLIILKHWVKKTSNIILASREQDVFNVVLKMKSCPWILGMDVRIF